MVKWLLGSWVVAALMGLKGLADQVEENKQWIRDWYAVLNVPERDKGQDDAIKELQRRIDVLVVLERLLNIIERQGRP